jgi:methanogenic corrinoid protein MtbC1
MLERVRASLAALPRPSVQTANAYAAAIDEMVARVNRSLSGHPELEVLIGENPPRVMFDNHCKHAHFIGAMLQHARFELLPATLPWVYRAYIGQGFASRYFLEELSAWRRALTDVLDESSAASILPLYNWIDQHHEDWIALSLPPSKSPLLEEGPFKNARILFYEALRSGEVRRALGVASEVGSEPERLLHFFERIVAPALAQVGLDWELEELTSAEEHRATAIVLRALALLQMAEPPPGKPRGHAVVTAAPNEYHAVGAQMLAMLLERDGWSVSYLGANTPAEELAALVRHVKPVLLAISVSMVYNLESVAQVASALRSDESSQRVKVMVGGFGLRTLQDAERALGVDAAPKTLEEALHVAREWSGPGRRG